MPRRDLTEDEVRAVIQTFWQLDAGKAHLADFVPLMDDEWFIRAVDEEGNEVTRFDGLSGLEDHQQGKDDFFDEEFHLRTFECSISGDRAVAHTTADWTFRYRPSRGAKSTLCRAQLAHEWYVRRHPERGTIVMSGHTCTHFAYLPGAAPPGPTERDRSEAASTSLHIDPKRFLAGGR